MRNKNQTCIKSFKSFDSTQRYDSSRRTKVDDLLMDCIELHNSSFAVLTSRLRILISEPIDSSNDEEIIGSFVVRAEGIVS